MKEIYDFLDKLQKEIKGNPHITVTLESDFPIIVFYCRWVIGRPNKWDYKEYAYKQSYSKTELDMTVSHNEEIANNLINKMNECYSHYSKKENDE